jgi:hypothetical protein
LPERQLSEAPPVARSQDVGLTLAVLIWGANKLLTQFVPESDSPETMATICVPPLMTPPPLWPEHKSILFDVYKPLDVTVSVSVELQAVATAHAAQRMAGR